MTPYTAVPPGNSPTPVTEGARYHFALVLRHPISATPKVCKSKWRHAIKLGLMFLFLGVGLGVVLYPTPSPGAPLQDQQVLTVPVNKSRILDLREPIARVSVANPAIADILVINPKQVYVNGKELGSTNMILWGDQDQVIRQIGLEVTHDLEVLKEKLYRVLPGERIKVESAHGSLVLSGTVSSPARMASAVDLASTFTTGDKAKVINLIQVGGAQQVLLEVRVAEVKRSFGKELDSNILAAYDDGNGFRIGAINGLVNNLAPSVEYITDAYGNITDTIVNQQYNSIFPFTNLTNSVIASIASGNFTMDMYLRAAEEKGLGRILAEPNLTTLSGQEAEFLSGGSIPYTTTQTNGSTNTEWKNYGIELKFIPFVMESGKINLKVNVSVSEPGPPALTNGQQSTTILSRGANATVEVPSGQSIAIAGLLSEKATDANSRLPGLGDIPLLGMLFRNQSLKNDQTELLIFVTPRLANPINTKQIRLPTEGFVEPSDVEFYLMGKMTSTRSGSSSPQNAGKTVKNRLGPDSNGSEGVFGHDL